MPFYMNPFDQEFRGDLLLADRKYIPTFVVPAAKNKSDLLYAWNAEPYDFATDNQLTINYAWDPSLKAFSPIAINVQGATPAATLASEVVIALNNTPAFSALFTANVKSWVDKNRVTQNTVVIFAKRPAQTIRVYVSNDGAEQKLKFNLQAGVGEMPSFFSRHLISNFQDPESEARLLLLDGTNPIDQAIIRGHLKDPNWTNSDLRADWQLLGGRSGMFTFKSQVVDTTGRVTQIIEYPAGAVAGDFAKKTTFSYTTTTTPTEIAEVPYVLQQSDLITPP